MGRVYLENLVIRNVHESKTQELIAVWRNMHNEETHDLCLSPKVICLMKSRRMRFTDHVTGVEI